MHVCLTVCTIVHQYMFSLTRTRSATFPTLVSSLSSSLSRHFLPHSTLTQALPCTVHSDETLNHLLQHCIPSQTLDSVRPFHALLVVLNPYLRQPIYFYNNVITLYANFRQLDHARKVFDEMPQRNGVSYNAMVSGYGREGRVEDAWDVLCEMHGSGFGPTQFTFGALLSCAALHVREGWVLHGLMVKNGVFWGGPHGGTALIGMYGRHGCISEAVQVFDEMNERSVVTWNAVISLLGGCGFVEECVSLFCEMRRSNCGLSVSTLVGLLSGLAGQEALKLGEQMHGLAVKNGLNRDVSSTNALINMCIKCLDNDSAGKLFDEAPLCDVVTYNTLIGALAKSDMPEKGIELLLSLSLDEILPNETTYAVVVSCCTNLQIPIFGEYIHAKVIKSSLRNDVLVGTALVDLYGKCGMLASARSCFDEIYDKNMVSWNILIMAFSSKGLPGSTNLLREMLQLGYCPDEFTFSTVLKSSSIFEAQQVHGLIVRMGYFKNEYVFNSLLTSYAKNGLLSDALLIATSMERALSVVTSNVIAACYSRAGQYYESLQTLSEVAEPDIVSWNVLISACSHSGHHREAFELFKHMLEVQIYPDNYTVFSILCSCSSLHSLSLGSSVHGLLIKTNFNHCDAFIHNALMDMYAKCGIIKDSLKVFKGNHDKNLITWTTMISALGHHGFAHEALGMFRKMEFVGIKPDAISFLAVLSACRHGGLVKEGMELFSRMQGEYNIQPKMDHYQGIVDLLARHGHLKEAEQVIASMPFPPNALIWRSFLGGYKRWKTLAQGQLTYQQAKPILQNPA